MALVAVATGEFYGSSGWSAFRYAAPSSRRGSNHLFLLFAGPGFERLKPYFPLVVLAALLLVAGIIFWLYVSSVSRFILFNSVLENHCNPREEWRRWRSQGVRFFYWWICFGLGVAAFLGVLAGAAAFVFWTSGALRNPRAHVVLLVLGGMGFVLLALAGLLVAALGALFARDFVVPVMALENVGVTDGWRRVIRMVSAEKTAYAGYVLVKIVLVVGSAILFGILTLLALLALLVPLSIGGFATYVSIRSAGLLLNPLTISIAVLLGGAALALIIYVAAFVSEPAMVFFQSYMIHFLGSRYAILGERLAALPGPSSASPPATPSPAG